MFSISASLCRTGKALMPCFGSTQEILVLLQEQDDLHAPVDIHGSPVTTAAPTAASHHHRHLLPAAERAPLPALEALMSGANFSYEAR